MVDNHAHPSPYDTNLVGRKPLTVHLSPVNPPLSHWNLFSIPGSLTDPALFTLDEQYTKTALLDESIQGLFCQALGLTIATESLFQCRNSIV